MIRTLLIAAAIALTAPLDLVGQSGQVGLPLGSVAPDAAVEDLDGNSVQLSALMDGKTTLIEFWATWCEQCEALQPQMDQVQAQFGDQVNVLAVAVAVAQSQRRVKRHLEGHDPGYPYVWDAKGEAVRAFEAPTTAVVVIVNADGTVAYSGVGADQDLVSAVSDILGGR